MVARLRSVLGTTRDEYATVICLDIAESYWNIEINIEYFSLLSLVIYVIECYDLLVELEEVDLIGSGCF